MDLFRSADGGLTWTALDLRKKKPLNPTTYLSDMPPRGSPSRRGRFAGTRSGCGDALRSPA
jgi:hypothetical protein